MSDARDDKARTVDQVAGFSAAEWLGNAGISFVLGALRLLPYRKRVPLGGWVVSRLVAPLAGFRKRIRANLARVCPDLLPSEVEELVVAVPDNLGRSLTELFSPEGFLPVARATAFEGPGLEALEQARAAGRAAILVSGHFGNYDVIRAGMIARGFDVGGLYRPMNNRYFNTRYVATISRIGQPLFERGRRGMTQMIRHLKGGGTLAILIDQHMGSGAVLTFFGEKAATALSTAELALKYDAVVVPCYAIRQPDGMRFKAVFEEPVPHTDAMQMTQALNDSLEARVRENMGQWLWSHRRWKVVDRLGDATNNMTTKDNSVE